MSFLQDQVMTMTSKFSQSFKAIVKRFVMAIRRAQSISLEWEDNFYIVENLLNFLLFSFL
jgi:hypothetical protein